jgi:hypothetical protein
MTTSAGLAGLRTWYPNIRILWGNLYLNRKYNQYVRRMDIHAELYQYPKQYPVYVYQSK